MCIDRERLLSGLLSCLADDDQNVRKVASYALGNAAFHSSRLYSRLRPAVPHLVRLLQDQLSKTRSNAAGVVYIFVELRKTLFVVVIVIEAIL